MKKRHIALPLAVLLLASPANFLREKSSRADNSPLENIVNSFKPYFVKTPTEIEEVTIIGKLTKPIQLKEVVIYGKKPRFEDIDKENRQVYISKKELNHYVDSLYSKIKMPSEISKTFFKKVIKYESWYNIYALSEEDARGLGQIIESSWNKVETKIPYEPGVYNPAKNLEVSMKILKNIYSTNRRLNPYWKTADAEKRKEYLLTCYNWGSKNLKEKGWNLKKAPKKTKKYIDNVLGK